MPSAASYIARKQSVPTDLRTAQLARLDTWTRERAFVMAGVANAEYLQAYRDQIQAILQGRISPGQAREALRRQLSASGYRPEAGMEGTIKDLSSTARLKVAIDTNVAMARGWAQTMQMRGDIGHPGLMLYRAGQAEEPRDWTSICSAYAGMDGVCVTGNPDEPMVALSNSPVWSMISEFGNSYPPFRWGSKMRTKPVSLQDCIEVYGIIDPDDADGKLAGIEQDRPESLNANTEWTPDISEAALRDALAGQLQGLAEWQGDKLVMTDPNGTRPYDWDAIGKVITAELPDGIPQMQSEAWRDWGADSSRFTADADKSVGLDKIEDAIRLFGRINPVSSTASGQTIFRGLKMPTEEARDKFLDGITAGGYGTRPGYLGESWSPSEANAQRYTGNTPGVVLECSSYKSRRRIDGLYRAIPHNNPDPAHPVRTEGESIMMAGVRYRVVKTRKEGKLVYVTVEEI